jgi:predicted Zn-dependent protease with MMP-like domain
MAARYRPSEPRLCRLTNSEGMVAAVYAMEPVDFEAEVGRVLANLPHPLSSRIANVAFGVEDGFEQPDLLGLYEGTPLTRRGIGYSFTLPDRITLYRNPILTRCSTHDDVVRRIEIVVKHEIGHYFGLSDARLHELGYA